MFDPDDNHLFGQNELEERFHGWNILQSRAELFSALRAHAKIFRPHRGETASKMMSCKRLE
jgi:hypothetical protein